MTINSGEDIAHLGELDQKLWTVLSCPVKGLEFDAETLRLMDTDNDGKIRVNEVVAASQWLCGTLKTPDRILDGADHIALADLSEGDDGAAVCSAAQRILQRKGVEAAEISMADVAEAKAAFDEKVKAKDDTTAAAVDERPYGDNTDDAIAAIGALKEKVADYFMRCKLIAFDENCAEAVDVSVEKIQAISEMNLATCSDKIADYPLARPNKEMRLTMGAGINPAWQAAFDKAKSLVLTVDYPEGVGIALHGGDTADADVVTAVRVAAGLGDHDAGRGALESLGDGKRGSLQHRLGVDRCDGTGYVALLLRTVTDDHGLIEELGVLA